MNMNEDDDCNSVRSELDCAVCLQKCNHPTQLPCGHVFCFLCVKGIAFQSKKCAMCRAVIPPTYLDNPILLGTLSVEHVNVSPTEEVYQWFYEGRNGWWKYDERSNFELESAFNAGDPDCTLLLAGTLYNIDFQSMTQVRRSDQTRRRRVRRDTPMFPSKGIAGIKTDDTPRREVKSDDEESPDVVLVQTEDEVIEISDEEENVYIEPAVTHQEDVNHVVDRIRRIEKTPTLGWKKDAIQNWLQSKNISFEVKEVKRQLMEKVNKVKENFKSYVIDEMAKEKGVTVLRLPPYHCELNPIELIWADIKSYVARHNTTFKFSDLKSLLNDAIAQVDNIKWANCVEHIKKIEKQMLGLDHSIDKTIDEFIIHVSGDDSDSDSSESSESEDEDGEE